MALRLKYHFFVQHNVGYTKINWSAEIVFR